MDSVQELPGAAVLWVDGVGVRGLSGRDSVGRNSKVGGDPA